MSEISDVSPGGARLDVSVGVRRILVALELGHSVARGPVAPSSRFVTAVGSLVNAEASPSCELQPACRADRCADRARVDTKRAQGVDGAATDRLHDPCRGGPGTSSASWNRPREDSRSPPCLRSYPGVLGGHGIEHVAQAVEARDEVVQGRLNGRLIDANAKGLRLVDWALRDQVECNPIYGGGYGVARTRD